MLHHRPLAVEVVVVAALVAAGACATPGRTFEPPPPSPVVSSTIALAPASTSPAESTPAPAVVAIASRFVAAMAAVPPAMDDLVATAAADVVAELAALTSGETSLAITHPSAPAIVSLDSFDETWAVVTALVESGSGDDSLDVYRVVLGLQADGRWLVVAVDLQ